jgi:ABC-type protease/lipase transport system fused ATPase/permease subunit
LRRVRRALLAAAAMSAMISGLMLVLPAFALQLFGSILPSGSLEGLWLVAGGAIVVLSVAGIVDFCRTLILLRAGLWVDHCVGAMMLEAAIGRGEEAGTLRSQADAIGAVRRVLTGGRLGAAFELPWAAAGCAALMWFHPLLGSAALLVVVLSYILCRLAAGRSLGAGHRDTNRARLWLEAVAPHLAELSAMGAAGGIARRWQHDNRGRTAKAYHLGWRFGLANALSRVLFPAGIAAVVTTGAYLVIADNLAPAVVVAAGLLVMRAQSTIEQVVGGLQEFREGRAGWRVLVEAERRLAPASSGHADAKSARGGELSLEAVSTFHAGEQKRGLGNVDLRVAPGECIGVIGARGAGKSTLLRTLAGVVAPASGRASLDGRPLALHQRSMASRAIGFMGETCGLLPGSIAENIAGFEEYSIDRVVAAADRAGVHKLLSSLPHGYDSDATGADSTLSLRQARAVCLARALYGLPSVVILDEPELGANADEIAELCAILQGLRRDGVTVVLVTSEPRLLQSTDRLAVMAGGAIECVLPSRQLQPYGATVEPFQPDGLARAA